MKRSQSQPCADLQAGSPQSQHSIGPWEPAEWAATPVRPGEPWSGWVVASRPSALTNRAPRYIASVLGPHDDPEAAANARLIACAPEMRAALGSVWERIQHAAMNPDKTDAVALLVWIGNTVSAPLAKIDGFFVRPEAAPLSVAAQVEVKAPGRPS